MKQISLVHQQAISELADLLYPLLPGSTSPYGNQKLTFPAAAERTGLRGFYTGGSKRPAIVTMLEETLLRQPAKFTDLIDEIVRTAITKKSVGPITQNTVNEINAIIRRIGYRSPQLTNPSFLSSLPKAELEGRTPEPQPSDSQSKKALEALASKMMEITQLSAQARGYAFEGLLNELFKVWDLAPRSPFRLTGEQIDGSFMFQTNPYLLEARWRDAPANQADLLAFEGKVIGKAAWSRGVFVSYAGYSADGLAAFARGKPTRIICIDGSDFWCILEARLSLAEVLEAKIRRAAETNEAFVPVTLLFPGRL